MPDQDSRASTILSARVEHSKWYDLFAGPHHGRVVHNAYILPLDSKKSMRQVMAEEDKEDINKLLIPINLLKREDCCCRIFII